MRSTKAPGSRSALFPFALVRDGLVPCALLAVSLAGCHSAAPPHVAPIASWPTPAGWRAEAFRFPLDFAKDIPHAGLEDVRFAPSFFDPKAPTYFSYSFAWVLDDPALPAGPQLADELRRYFYGLAVAVGEEKHATVDANAFRATVDTAPNGNSLGEVQALDPFNDDRPVVLHLDATQTSCGAKKVLLVTLSPRPPGDATWSTLLAQRATFQCPP